MTTSLTAKFDGKVFVPDGPVDVPAGQSVRLSISPITLPSGASPAGLRALLDRHERDPDAMKEVEARIQADCERIDKDGW